MMTLPLKQSVQPEDLAKIQYFLSDEVALFREVSATEQVVTPGHQVHIVNGKRIERVIFPKRSPGVVVEIPSETVMMISFEEGPPEMSNPALPFSVNSNDGLFALKSGETISYLGKDFQVCAGTGKEGLLFKAVAELMQQQRCSDRVTLIVDLKTDRKKTKTQRVVPGRRLKEK